MKYRIAATVGAAAVLLASCAGQPDTEGAGSSDPEAEASQTMPADRAVSLVRVGGAHVPVGESSPSRQSGTSASGWQERDSDLAAAWFATVVDGAQEASVRAAAVAQVAPPDADDEAQGRLQAEADQVAAERDEVHSDGPSQEAWMPDLRILGYLDEGSSGEDRTVSVWGRSDGTPEQWWTRTITVRWSENDWRWVSDPWPEQWSEGTPPDDLIPYMSSEGVTDE